MAVSSTTSTGINVPEIVSGLMDVERVPVTKLQTQVDQKTLVISTLGVFQSKVSALESAAKALTTPGIYALRDTTSSDATKVSATASNSAAAATYAVKVAQTAQAEAEVLGGFQSASQVIDLDEFSLTVGTGDDAVTYSPQFATLTDKTTFTRNERITMTLNGQDAQTFSVTTQTTASEVANAINAAVTAGTLTGVFASVSADDELQIDSVNAIQGVSASLDTPGYVTFDSSPTFASGDVITFTLSDGTPQSFTLTTQDSARTVASAINAAVTAGTLSGVYATVVSDDLRIASIDPSKGLIASLDQGVSPVVTGTPTSQTSADGDPEGTGVVSETFTLANLASSINSLGASLQAAVIQSGAGQYSLSISSTITGADNAIAIGGISSPDQQLDRVTLSGTYAAGDVVTITVNGDPFIYQVTSDDLTADGAGGAAVLGNSDTAYANIATNIAALFDGHADVEADATDGVIDFSAVTGGVSHTISVSSGAAAAVIYEETAASDGVEQVARLELKGQFTAGDVISVTIEGVPFNYTVLAADIDGDGATAATHTNIATALAAAYGTGSTAVATSSGNAVDFTALTANEPFGFSAAKTVAATSSAGIAAANLVANVENFGITEWGAESVSSAPADGSYVATYDGVSWIVSGPDDVNYSATLSSGTFSVNDGVNDIISIADVVGSAKAGDRITMLVSGTGTTVAATLTEHASIELQSARDAFVSINGQALQRSSNSIDDVVSGVTFNLNTPTVPSGGAITALSSTTFASGTTDATINVTAGAQDLSAEAVTDFVTAYNDLISFYKTETVASTDPNSRGVLNGDSNVRSFMDRLRGLYSQGIRLADGSNISFGSIGVEFQRDGTLYLDTGALNTAVSNGLQDKLAAGVTLGYESSTSNFTSFLTASLRTTGLISTHLSDVEAQQAQLEERISDWEDKLSRIQDRYYRQYAALDALLFRLQTTSNALASAIDSLVNSQKN
ncbi:flagellar filament capping protein FliD [Betaproteobacteria bacterium LSUCC0115]|nr:flagellar filament capping protein FliD [Burkholderiales bacterium LSUCC0115]